MENLKLVVGEKKNMQQESTENWIDYIINKAIDNYNGRNIVIWGKYGVSDSIKDGLKEKYGIDIAFYVDSDIRKADGKKIFPPEHLYGKSDKYYVIIPIAFYLSVKDKLTGGGIILIHIIIIFVTVFYGRNRNTMKTYMEIGL